MADEDVVEIWDVVATRLPLLDVFVQRVLWHGLLVALVIGGSEQFSDGQMRLAQVCLDRQSNDRHGVLLVGEGRGYPPRR